MIKCPECGNPVSTLAGTCPQCGVKIHGHLRQCSQCGTYYFKAEHSCPYCDHSEEEQEETPSATTSASEPQQPPTSIEEKTSSQPPQHNRNKWWRTTLKVLLWTLGIGTTCAGGYVGYLYYQNHNQRMEEKVQYEKLAVLTNPEFYRQYIQDYPQSIYIPKVKKRLEQLLGEENAWQKALKLNTKEDYNTFLESYPTSLNSRKCQQLIDSIDWATALQSGTEEAMNNYLSEHPEGLYTSEAVEFKKTIDGKKTTPEENEAVSNAVTEFFTTALAQADKATLEAAIAQPMQSFCGTPKAGVTHLQKFVKNKKTKEVTSLKFLVASPVNVCREKLFDNTTGYRAQCTVEEIITRKSKKNKTTEKNYQATCLLDGKLKLVKVELTPNKEAQ